ncbi:plastidial pyruvate kinase 4, chloroplastic isoform X2 [Castanea sativa]|uniref:plastidial pyruvate kinase 4, chloroplastic isoform X2 n=1 Tax=Castanea sativa TaxID=21020 RepID=UPI003F64949E
MTTMGALSAYVVANQAIQTADILQLPPSNLRRELQHPPCRFHVKQPTHIFQILATHGRNQKPRMSAFAVPDENNKAEMGSSHDDPVLVLSKSKKSSKDPDVKVVASSSHSQANFCPNSEQTGSQGILDKLKAVHLHVLASEQWNASLLKLCHRNYLVSATNLVHYLALKCLDLEQLNEDLSSVGLLNLETVNSHILASLTAAIRLLETLKLNSLNTKENIGPRIDTQNRIDQLKNEKFTIHTLKKAFSDGELLLGPLQHDKTTHIMVTVGQEALGSETLITDLIKMGASIIRINCAHGNPSDWSEIIRRVKRSSQLLEKPCRILMDLAGPKLRTGKLKPGECVMKISPKKNATGNVYFPAQVWLCHKGAGPPPAHFTPDAVLFIDDQEFFSKINVGDTVRFHDIRGRKRMLKICRRLDVFSGTGYVAECSRTAYVESGTELYVKRKKLKFPIGKVVDVPSIEPFIRLRVGDLLIISRDCLCEQDELPGPTSSAPIIACSSGLLFDSVKPGDPIAFDDGKIWGVVQGTSISEIIVSITHAGPKGTKLGSEKSINIPESNIWFEGLTSKDLMDLDFVSANADMVGVSFVRDVRDIVVLCQEFEKRKVQNLGVVLKIETKSAFEKLPLLLLEAMKSSNPLGVMIARGDLAVECGWEKLADVQDEILSVCNAAHIPVIWATQVLESLVKSGVPTRAELTDVASGRRLHHVEQRKTYCRGC